MVEMTKEQKRINKANHKKAAEFFKLQKGWVLHHIDPDWRHNDIERYILWDPFDLAMMTRSDHQRLHQKMMTEETKKKLSEALKGKKLSEEHKNKLSESMKGHQVSEETRNKIAESKKGKNFLKNIRKNWRSS